MSGVGAYSPDLLNPGAIYHTGGGSAYGAVAYRHHIDGKHKLYKIYVIILIHHGNNKSSLSIQQEGL